MSYEINYNDERFQKVEADKKQALTENEKLYGGMVSESDKYYQAQIDASQQWADKQTQLQQEKTDFAIEKIEQQKEQAHKDYTKEQSGAYVDWQKQSNNYGANAEQMATMGLTNTGYSESSQVQMYTAYQNRVATARESYNRAVVDYNNAITEARLQNNSILAEIAYEALQKKLELGLQGFQYKNTLLLDQANKKLEIDQMYHGRYQDVLNQMNTENALAEQVRQFNENLAEERRQYNETMAFNREQFNWQKSQASAKSGGSSSSKKSSSSGGSSGSTKSSKSSSSGNDTKSNKRATQSVSTYSEAAKALRDAGATKGDGGLMTEGEWKRRKYAGSTSAETSYDSYNEYINSFVNWKKQNPD